MNEAISLSTTRDLWHQNPFIGICVLGVAADSAHDFSWSLRQQKTTTDLKGKNV